MMSEHKPAGEGASQRARAMSYSDYLALPQVLNAQKPLTDAHDELLFIVQHQTTELWMKLAIHEMTSAKASLARDEVEPAFKMLSRLARIFEQLNGAWDVLRTMTPSEYSMFRSALGQSSGLESYQYRTIEYLAGNKSAAMLKPHDPRPEVRAALDAVRRDTSLYDEAIRLLARSGLAVDAAVLTRDVTQPYVANDSVRKAWTQVYRDPRAHWSLYELAEKLIDFEDYFRRWRFNHVTTVERVIGFKRGTGGTSGVSYLKRMLEVVLFPELWELRTEL
jgi:tryptophan 2,3-dioxygenase